MPLMAFMVFAVLREGIDPSKADLPPSICSRDLGSNSSIPEGDLKKTKQVHRTNFSTSAQKGDKGD